jgi:hypothetical protein
VQTLWLDPAAATSMLERAVKKITWAQTRNAIARKSHTKTTHKKLKRLGIQLSQINRCQWPKPET